MPRHLKLRRGNAGFIFILFSKSFLKGQNKQ